MQEVEVKIDDEPGRKFFDARGIARAEFWPKPVSVRWIRTLVARKEIPFMKLGGRFFFDPPTVEAHMMKKLHRRAR